MPAKDTLVAWLRYVIEESELHTRSEWGHIIGVSPQAQGRWLAGKDSPRPEILRRLIVALRDDTSVPGRQAMKRWEDLSRRSIAEVCPGTRHDAPTLAHLIVEPLWDNLQRTMRAFPPALQERILTDAIRAANRYILERDGDIREPASSDPLPADLTEMAPTAVARYGAGPITQAMDETRSHQSWWSLSPQELH